MNEKLSKSKNACKKSAENIFHFSSHCVCSTHFEGRWSQVVYEQRTDHCSSNNKIRTSFSSRVNTLM